MDHQSDNKYTTTSGHIKTVAIIGAGLSGVVSAAHLLRAGIDVTVFERGGEIGGAWIYSEQPDRDPPFPNDRRPSLQFLDIEGYFCDALQQASRDTAGVSMSISEAAAHIFAPPGPVYTNMKSRGTEVIMRTTLRDWPEGVKAPIDPGDVVAYLRDIADTYQVRDKIRFHTSVDSITKDGDNDGNPVGDGRGSWRIRTSKLVSINPKSYKRERETWDFDAVVVAAGRYGIPHVPDIPGLAQWKARFPGRVKHTKQYRTAEPYRGKTVLVVGAHISALDITNELVGVAGKVYQSARPTETDFRSRVRRDGETKMEMVAMVAEFAALADDHGHSDSSVPTAAMALDNDLPIPGRVVLSDGRILDDVDHILFATGYLTTFPFLGPVLEQPLTEPQDADEAVVITADARTVHNLHEDIFYIPDPTLAFVGVTQYASTFSLFDIQALVLAAVWAGRARLPSQAAMREEQRRRKARLQRLPGALLNGVYLLDDFVIRRLLDWINEDMMEEEGGSGGNNTLAGPDAEWWAAFRAEREGARAVIGRLQDHYLDTYGTSWEQLQSRDLSSAHK
ncbi:FAD dependent oxidoreductase protein [Apiospora arundinis]